VSDRGTKKFMKKFVILVSDTGTKKSIKEFVILVSDRGTKKSKLFIDFFVPLSDTRITNFS
jgi:hypothetical protein